MKGELRNADMYGEKSDASRRRLKSLNLLKGIATIAVFFVHTAQLFCDLPTPFVRLSYMGARGCQCFFLCSGMGIACLCGTDTDVSINWKTFYKKRWKRIAPLYIVFVLFWCAVAWLCDSAGIQRFMSHNDNIWCIIGNVLLLNGLFTNGYNDVVPGGWYVGVAVLLYILTPAIIKILKKAQKNNALFMCMPIYCYAACAETYFILQRMNEGVFNNFFQLAFLTQMPSYILGIWIIFVFKDGFRPSKWSFGFMMCMIAFSVIDSYENIGVFKISEFLWTITFFAIFFFFETNDFQTSIIRRCIERLGTISYEFYFVHVVYVYIGFVFFKQVIVKMGFYAEGFPAWLLCSAAGFLLTYFTSELISFGRRTIEKHLRPSQST